MLVAIIEFEMNPETQEEFSGLIGGLQSQVETIDGFISADPAASLNNDGMMYEISYWRDADALAAWAKDPLHIEAMQAGRDRLLKWFRIRVAEINRDWSDGAIPADSPAAKGA